MHIQKLTLIKVEHTCARKQAHINMHIYELHICIHLYERFIDLIHPYNHLHIIEGKRRGSPGGRELDNRKLLSTSRVCYMT
jgi:hypothetical protein